jgi:hypothetical protein
VSGEYEVNEPPSTEQPGAGGPWPSTFHFSTRAVRYRGSAQ